jgi:hypothetical protein
MDRETGIAARSTACTQDCLNTEQPFSRVVALGYYDGPTSGVAECRACLACYRFELLDELPDWDAGDDLRVFSLAPLSPEAFERLVNASPGSEAARWPLWVPRWEFASEAERQEADRTVQQVLDSAPPPCQAIATRDNLSEVVACRRVTSEELASVRDWVAFLGLGELRNADNG